MHAPVALLILLLLTGCGEMREERLAVSVAAALGGAEPEELGGFARAQAPRPFRFPRDHGAHPEFRNEWWYLTGNLTGSDGREFGYQLTFFRIALRPPPAQDEAPRRSRWATSEVWMAHAALTDVAAGHHFQSERLARGGAGLAGSTRAPLRIWLDDWQLTARGSAFPWHLSARGELFAIDLTVEPLREVALQGEEGLSRKSDAPGNASYYYSITRLATRGTLRVQGEEHAVRGLSWLDREWGTSALGPEQAGWDWFALQLDSGEDLMFYRLRNRDGSVHPLSRGSWLDRDGGQRPLLPGDLELDPVAHWRGPGGELYPTRWRLRLRHPEREWIVAAALERQLMETIVRYWEGAVDVLDAGSGERVGRGYLEMTGYLGAGGAAASRHSPQP